MENAVTRFYNRISFLYPIINYFLERHKKLLIKEVNNCSCGNVLEIGIGNGSHLPLYDSHQITGIDISTAMLAKAIRYKATNIELLNMDGENLMFEPASFDYVVLCHVLAVTKDPEKLLGQVYKVLKPGAKLFILNHFTPDNLLRYIDKIFQPLSCFFHFKSSFYQKDIKGFRQFSLLQETGLGKYSYFKILIFSKP